VNAIASIVYGRESWQHESDSMNSANPTGLYPILYAYFDSANSLRRDAIQRQVQCCIDAGADGIAVLGLITETGQLSVVERENFVAWVAEEIDGRVPLAATISGDTAQAQIALGLSAVRSGASWLILQPPQDHKPDEQQLLRFFGEVMDSVDVPVGIQNFPEVLGVGLSPAAVGELHRQHPNFTVMKGEGPVYQIRAYMDASDGGIGIFNGRGGLELPDNLRAGCAGIIPAPDVADIQVRMYQAFKNGDSATLDRLYRDTLPYVVFVMQSIHFALVYGKRLNARRMGIDGSAMPRAVVAPLDDFGLERLAAHSATFGEFGRTVD